MNWHPISEAPKRSGVYFVYAPSADPKKPFFHVAYYDAESGWSGLVPAWLNALTHWMEPVPPTPFDHGSFEAMDGESRITDDPGTTEGTLKAMEHLVKLVPEVRVGGESGIVLNARRCGICGSPADRRGHLYQCQANNLHVGDVNVGIFTDLSYPEK